MSRAAAQRVPGWVRFWLVALSGSLLTGFLPASRGLSQSPTEPLHVRIDRAIAAAAPGPFAGPTTDEEFLRRVSLDLAGTIPTPAEVAEFTRDSQPDKRTAWIDRLLAAPTYGRRMQEYCSTLLLERRGGSPLTDAEWNQYLRESFQANKPWDRLVRELLFADDDVQLKPARKFLTVAGRDKNLHQQTQDVARILLGRSIMCAQCHDHPNVADYSQADYFGLYAYLQDKPEQARSEFESVFAPGKKETWPRLPGKEPVTIPVVSQEQPAAAAEAARAHRPRLLLARDLPQPDNALFVRNTVNRLWCLLMGRGLVHPLDLHHQANPPSHPELLDQLAAEFARTGCDVKHLLREIALSQSYQRSSRLPEGVTEADAPPSSYRVFNSRLLTPEQFGWSLLRATGNLSAWEQAGAPAKSDFGWYNYINGRIAQVPATVPEVLDLFAGVFGNPPGEAEVDVAPTMGQALFVLNERLLLTWLEPRDGNLLARVRQIPEPAERIRELYVSILSRGPTPAETAGASEWLAAESQRGDAALADLAWALLASDEFRLNH
ncbi:MAG: DUF1553 domain-containing protein [Pirellulales bacterium]